MFDQLKKSLREFKRAEPGTRFQQQYRAHQTARKHKWSRPLFLILGVTLVAVGIVALPAPGPGTVVLAFGAALLARESKSVARALDWLEVRLRRLLKWSRSAWNNAPRWGKGAIVLAGLGLSAAAAWAGYAVLLRG